MSKEIEWFRKKKEMKEPESYVFTKVMKIVFRYNYAVLYLLGIRFIILFVKYCAFLAGKSGQSPLTLSPAHHEQKAPEFSSFSLQSNVTADLHQLAGPKTLESVNPCYITKQQGEEDKGKFFPTIFFLLIIVILMAHHFQRKIWFTLGRDNFICYQWSLR